MGITSSKGGFNHTANQPFAWRSARTPVGLSSPMCRAIFIPRPCCETHNFIPLPSIMIIASKMRYGCWKGTAQAERTSRVVVFPLPRFLLAFLGVFPLFLHRMTFENAFGCDRPFLGPLLPDFFSFISKASLLQIGTKLKWRPYVKEIQKKMATQTRALTKITSTWGVTFARARHVYCAVVRPAITYGSAI